MGSMDIGYEKASPFPQQRHNDGEHDRRRESSLQVCHALLKGKECLFTAVDHTATVCERHLS
jgi:hypothetical protein